MRWTEEDLQYLLEHYADVNTAEIAKHLGRTEGARTLRLLSRTE